MLMAPLLLCLDLQRGFLEPGSLYAPHAPHALVHGRRMLAHAREKRWRIAHCFQAPRAGPALISAYGAKPVDGFEPLVREMVFERHTLSAYGNDDFARLMHEPGAGALVTCLNASLSLMATAIDAFERGHRLIVAGNAIAGPSGLDASAAAHEAVTRDVARLLGFFVGSADASGPHVQAVLEQRSQSGGIYK